MKLFCTLFVGVIGILCCDSPLRADTFGSGANSFEIKFVTIGNPGNPADTTGAPNPAGSVPYSYRIGKYEISEQMIDKANALGNLGITHHDRGPNKPAVGISWIDAVRFVNWLNFDAGYPMAYKFDDNGDFQLWQPEDSGYNPDNLFRNSEAKYFLPSVDEWYKAAYYDPIAGVYWDYPTGSNLPPLAVASGTSPGTAVYDQDRGEERADITLAGGLSPYGTMAQGGNASEWEETDLFLMNGVVSNSRVVRGGNWADGSSFLLSSIRGASLATFGGPGFRVASIIPEPSTAMLLGFISLMAVSRCPRLKGRGAD